MSELVVVGRVHRPHGLSGELSVEPRTEIAGRFSPGAAFIWTRGGERREVVLEAARPHGSRLLVSLAGIADAAAARELSGGDLCIDARSAAPPPEGFYLEREVRGWACEDPEGRPLGRVAGLERTAAGPTLTVTLPDGREAMVPFVHGIVLAVDRAARRVVLDPPEGLLDLATGGGA
jgi:16S rRNA processing protein RimM